MATQIKTGLIANDAITDAKIADVTLTTATQSASDNSTKIATTAYVTTAIANLADSAPATLNTLNELAAALGDDANFSTTVTNSIATKLPLAGGTLTGDLTVNSAGGVYVKGGGGLRLEPTDGSDTDAWILYQYNDNTLRYNFTGAGADEIIIKHPAAANTTTLEIDTANVAVGIGMSPSGYGKLSVNGTGVLAALRASSGAGKLGFYEGGAGRFYLQTLNGSDGLAFVDGDGTTEHMRIASDGKVSITASTAVAMDVQGEGGSHGLVIGGNDAGFGYIGHRSSGSYDLRIASGGNVGIGVTPANAKLEVVATSGEVFRADANSGAYRLVANQTGVIMQGRVGIGVASPNSSAAAANALYIGGSNDSYSPSAFNEQSMLSLDATNSQNHYASIRFTHNGGTEGFFGLVRQTTSSDIADFLWQGYEGDSNTYREYMRLTHAGHLAINGAGSGTTSANKTAAAYSALTVQTASSNGTVASGAFSHVGPINTAANANTDGYISGMSFGYFEGNNYYRHTAIAARAHGDGAARRDIVFLVNTASESASATLSDTKMTIHSGNGTTTIGNTTGLSDYYALRVLTANGYGRQGSHNSSFYHHDTDRGIFYWSKRCEASGGFHTYSDENLKKEITAIGGALESVSKMNGVTFKWKDPEKRGGGDAGKQFGVIAQNMLEVDSELPTLNVDPLAEAGNEESDDKFYTMDYTRITPYLIEAIKELKAKNEALEARIETLEG